jgi:oligosaccharyltransferase complex subunit beta
MVGEGFPPYSKACLSHRQAVCSFAKTGNEEFLVELTRWAFHERSVLRVSNLRHHPPNSTEQPSRYRITDEVVFEVDIAQYKDGSWQPYRCPPTPSHPIRNS